MFSWYYNYAHESAHARIYKNNKIKYKMMVTPFKAWCEGETETKATIRDHNLVDAVGYHLKVFLDVGLMLFVVIQWYI